MRRGVFASLACVAALFATVCGQSTASADQAPESVSQGAADATFQTERLIGKQRESGKLKSLSREAVELEVEGTTSKIPLAELEQLRREERLEEPENAFLPAVALQNGSQLAASSVKVAKRVVEVSTAYGALSFPVAEVRWLRLAGVDEKLDPAWSELTARDARNDLLVVRKGEALDFVAGVIGDIGDTDVKLLVKDRSVAVPRERVFGVIYVQQPSVPAAMCEVQLGAGDRLRLGDASIAGDNLIGVLGSTAKITVPLSQVASIDFTLGKVKSLADLPMSQSQFAKSPILTAASLAVRKNRNSLGRALRIGDREFPRGLWMHSGTSAVFRLGREYRRLTATIGLDSNSTELPRVAPKVKVVFLGDGKPIDTREVNWSDEPAALDLDVSGVRELEIRVEPPHEMPGILEHLVLGDARVIK